MENRPVDDQLDHPALRLIAARPDVFARQGNVAASFRRRGPKTFGPYYRLSYRDGGRQRSVYLGRAGQVVECVRQALGALQRKRNERRALNQLERRIRNSLRTEKVRLATLLRPFGLRLKGFEVRGWRFSPLRNVLKRCRRKLLPSITARLRTLPIGRDSPEQRLTRYLDARDGPTALAE